MIISVSLRWRHNGRVSYHQPHDCLLNRLFRRSSMKTSKLRVTGLCAGYSPVTGEFQTQMSSNAENISIWWRHHVSLKYDPRDPIVDRPGLIQWCPILLTHKCVIRNQLKKSFHGFLVLNPLSTFYHSACVYCWPQFHHNRLNKDTGIKITGDRYYF